MCSKHVWRSLKTRIGVSKRRRRRPRAKGGVGEVCAFFGEKRLQQALGYRPAMAAWREDATPAALRTTGQSVELQGKLANIARRAHVTLNWEHILAAKAYMVGSSAREGRIH
jgi:hypothetical protein